MDIQQKKNNLRMDIKHLLKSKYVSANDKIANLPEELYTDISNDGVNKVINKKNLEKLRMPCISSTKKDSMFMLHHLNINLMLI